MQPSAIAAKSVPSWVVAGIDAVHRVAAPAVPVLLGSAHAVVVLALAEPPDAAARVARRHVDVQERSLRDLDVLEPLHEACDEAAALSKCSFPQERPARKSIAP